MPSPADDNNNNNSSKNVQSTRADDVISIFIPRIRRKQSHVEYILEITGKSAVWNIYRRYQQFRDLHSSLSRLTSITDNYHTSKGVLPVLPGTSWIRVTSDDVDLVEKRRLHLEIYLQQLLVPSNKFYKDCPELRQFLHQDEMPLTYKNTLSRTVPGINAPLENEPNGSIERVFDDETEEDQRHQTVVASRPSDAVESAIAPEIPKMDDWSSNAKGHNDIANIASDFGAHGAGAVLSSSNNRIVNPGKEESSSPLNRAQLPYEICKNCGQRESINYDLEEWVPHGTCPNCGQLTEHDLVVPPESNAPNTGNNNTNEGDDDGEIRARPEGDDEEEETEDDDNKDEPASPDSKANMSEDEIRAAARRRAQRAGVPTVDALQDSNNQRPRSTSPSKQDPAANNNKNTPQQQQQQPPSIEDEYDVPKQEEIMQLMKSFDARCDISLSDFELITTLGRGTFGKVMKARYKSDNQIYAIKVLSKSMVHQKRMVDYVKEEKAIMALLPTHPFIVKLQFAFQTDHHLYFVMDFLTGGELYAHMQPLERLPLHAARFYAAELLLALEHVHKYDVCHRDLKPENIVLAYDGHIKLTDFGLARKAFSHKRRFSFVGSAEYLSPEVVRTEGQTKAIDWWGFGCMVYEFLTGRTPFHASTAREVYASILNRQVDYNKPGMTPEAQDLISKLLEKNPRIRLQDPNKMKRHPFFAGINWQHVYERKLKPPFVPDLKSNDTKYFSKEFTSEWATIPAAASATRGSIERLAQRFSNFKRIADHHAGSSGNLHHLIDQSSTAHILQKSNSGNDTPRSDGQTPRGSDQAITVGHAVLPNNRESRKIQQLTKAGTLYGRPLPSAENLHPLISLHVAETLASGTGGKIAHSLPQLKHIDPEEFVGVWRLLRVEMTSAVGQVVFPWGAEVAGQLIFTRNGLFACQICPIKRIRFRGISKPTREEMIEAFNSYVASFGNFFVVPGKPFIVQRATAALSPSLVGVLQKKYFDVDSDRKLLKLMSPFYRGEGGTLVFSSTTWSKVA